jgi:transposase
MKVALLARKGEPGCGAASKNPVFGLLKGGGKVFTEIMPDAKTEALLPIIRDKVVAGSIVYSYSFRSRKALDASEFKHYRINRSQLFACRRNHINGVENFWNQAKRHMRKFNAIDKNNFYLFFKECPWPSDNPNPTQQLKQL